MEEFFLLLFSALLVLSLTACGKKDSAADSSTSQPENESSTAEAKTADQLIVRFGGNGASFGEVYYSEPNRIVLFYQDAEISGEYTLVGHFDADEDFISAVEDNPVLEGWGNKIVIISAEE